MKPFARTYPFHLSTLVLFTTILSQASSAFAQDSNVVPDNTLGAESSVVNPRDENSDKIDGGAVRGQNLFHSFQEFNIGEGRGVYFSNPDAVTNILSRVTGNNVSNILGTLGVDGAANLYLINPNGIIFGEGASLDVQGSFTATTADAIEFGDNGFFSAVNPTESVLTISVPLGLQFGSNPGNIINRSYVTDSTDDFVGLQVSSGENLTLVGGNVRFEAGEATARGGNIEIGGLSESGTVTFNDDGSLSFPDNVAKADVTLSNAADIDVSSTGGGSVTVNARNISIKAGEFGSSQIKAGITADSTFSEAQAENIIINATDNITVDDSLILNQVDLEAVGEAGSITITTGSLTLTNGSQVSASTFGQGNAGKVEITATDTITFDGEDSDGFNSGVFSNVDTEAVGNAGDIVLNAGSLTLTNGGTIDATTRGTGNAGGIEITATNNITFDGEDSAGNSSGAFSGVDTEALGDAGGITVTTNSLTFSNGGSINTNTFGQGNAGDMEIIAADTILFDGENSIGLGSGAFSVVAPGGVGNGGNIVINTDSLTLTNGGVVDAKTLSEGNAGKIEIAASDNITFDGENSRGFPSGAFSLVGGMAVGEAGGITISTGSLTLTNGGKIDASTFGRGNAGETEITATDNITFDGEDLGGFPSGAFSQVNLGAEGDAGGINITTSSLTLTNGGRVDVSTLGEGNAGRIEITATNTITFDGENSTGFSSGVFSQISSEAVGNSDGISIETGSLNLTNGGKINVNTSGQGNAGSVNITATDTVTFDGENSSGSSSGAFSRVENEAIGDAGDINITTGFLNLTNGGTIDASTLDLGNAGSVNITASDNITFDGENSEGFVSGVLSLVGSEAEGNSDGINISTGSLNVTNGGIIDASTFGQGDTQGIKITATDTITFDRENSEGFVSGAFSQVGSEAVGNAEGVEIITGSLNLINGGIIDASTFGQGDTQGIKITATDTITFDGENSEGFVSGAFSQAGSEAVGNAEGIEIITGFLNLINGAIVDASTFGQGDTQGIKITATDTITFDGENSAGFGSVIFSQVETDAIGNSDGINISTGSLNLTNGGTIDASTLGQGNTQGIEITATKDITFDGEDSAGSSTGVFSQVETDAIGNSGGISISTSSLNLTNGGTIDASTLGRGDAGSVNITATKDITFDGEDSAGFPSGATSLVESEAVGNAGGVSISANSLTLTNGGRVAASTFGRGNAGSVNITATENINFDGQTLGGFPSGANSLVSSEAVGNAGEIDISTTNLTLTNESTVDVSSSGQGNAGQINISTTNLALTNGGTINNSIFGEGNGGVINITALENITFDGEGLNNSLSGVFSQVSSDAAGDGGDITISTNNLTLTNGGQFSANTLGQGNAGTINITATGDLTFDGESSGGFSSGILSQVESEAEGDAGEVKIFTDNLILSNGGGISSSTLGRGNAGAIEINATGDLTFEGFNSGVFSQVNPDAVGDAGEVRISTNNLTLTNGGSISSSTLGRGNAGAIKINATGDLTFDGEDSAGNNSGVLSQVGIGAVGNAGGVTISTNNLNLINGGGIDASTLGEGNAEKINIIATGDIKLTGEDEDGFSSSINSQSNPIATGNAGGVTISTTNLTLTDGGQIDSSIGGQGNAGAIEINATKDIIFDGKNSVGLPSGTTSLVEFGAVGNAGGVKISTSNLTMINGGRISVSTFGQGKGGELTVNANFLNLNNDALISSSSKTNFDAGDITLNIADSLQTTDSEISTSSTQSSGGNLTISAGEIKLRGNSDFTTNIDSGAGGGGNITLTADSIIAFDDSDIFAFADDGRGGDITLNTNVFFAENFTLNSLTSNPNILNNNFRADVNATGAVSGSVSIPDVSFIQNSLTELPNNSIDTDELVANSCVVPVGERKQGKFIITGGESLQVRPGDNLPSQYPTGEVRNLPENNDSSWQPGDPIIEPQGVYRLTNGKLVLSRECN